MERDVTFVRRTVRDRSQQVRRAVQLVFLVLNLWIGFQFLLWTRYYESHGTTLSVSRPTGVDGWLPIAGLMNLKYFFQTGQVLPIHPAAMVLTAVFLLMSLFLKKSFCSWFCPVGTVQEFLWKMGRKLLGRNVVLPQWLDIPLRGIKYLLLGFFLFIIATLSADMTRSFMYAPFGVLADVKMLNFFRHMGALGLAILLVLGALSMLVRNFWCRFLCPYGALMGLVSLLSPAKIRREKEACIDCEKCSKACPSNLPVAQLVQVRSVECIGCLECVSVCPAENALQFALPPKRNSESVQARWQRRIIQPKIAAVLVMALFLGFYGVARLSGHWKTNIPEAVYMRLVPMADSFSH